MKKILLLLAVISLNLTFSKAENLTQKKHADFEKFSKTSVTGLFSPIRIETFSYNGAIFENQEKSGFAETDSVPLTTTTFEYNNNVVTGITSLWQNNSWGNQFKTVSYLRSNTLIDSTVSYAYNSISGTWEKESKFVVEYENDLNTRDLVYVKDSLTNSWVVFLKTDYTYNSGLLTEEVMSMYIPEADTWMKMSKEMYFYVNEKLNRQESLYALPFTEQFEMSYKTQYFYDANGKESFEIDYDYDMLSQSWSANSKTDYLFNEKGMEFVSHGYNYQEGLDDPWVLTSKDSTVYANGEQPLIDLFYELYLEENKLLVYEKTYYSYSIPDNVLLTRAENLVSIFPNPAQNVINIQLKNPGNASLKIFNLNGQMVHQQNIVNENTRISTQHLNSGNYLIKTMNNGLPYSQIIVVK